MQAHIWEGQPRRQIYLGGFGTAEEAALAFDIVAVRLGRRETNFHPSYYEPWLALIEEQGVDDLVAGLRRQSKGASQQTSFFRGVTRHTKGRWESRIGQASGKRYLYLGLHESEVQAARAYDRAAIAQKGVAALTNFALAEYLDELSPELAAEAVSRGLIDPADLERYGRDCEAGSEQAPAPAGPCHPLDAKHAEECSSPGTIPAHHGGAPSAAGYHPLLSPTDVHVSVVRGQRKADAPLAEPEALSPQTVLDPLSPQMLSRHLREQRQRDSERDADADADAADSQELQGGMLWEVLTENLFH